MRRMEATIFINPCGCAVYPVLYEAASVLWVCLQSQWQITAAECVQVQNTRKDWTLKDQWYSIIDENSSNSRVELIKYTQTISFVTSSVIFKHNNQTKLSWSQKRNYLQGEKNKKKCTVSAWRCLRIHFAQSSWNVITTNYFWSSVAPMCDGRVKRHEAVKHQRLCTHCRNKIIFLVTFLQCTYLKALCRRVCGILVCCE